MTQKGFLKIATALRPAQKYFKNPFLFFSQNWWMATKNVGTLFFCRMESLINPPIAKICFDKDDDKKWSFKWKRRGRMIEADRSGISNARSAWSDYADHVLELISQVNMLKSAFYLLLPSGTFFLLWLASPFINF